jgi:putative PIN family toxin of toxin-antitoxin system
VGARKGVNRRVVFDTTTVVSALFFSHGRLVWLRQHWREKGCVPLISRPTVAELTRILGYPKFQLSRDEQQELLADYLPYCKVIEPTGRCPLLCRDTKDQPFLDLAEAGEAGLLVSGDRDLLTLGGRTTFLIESPEAYFRRISEER